MHFFTTPTSLPLKGYSSVLLRDDPISDHNLVVEAADHHAILLLEAVLADYCRVHDSVGQRVDEHAHVSVPRLLLLDLLLEPSLKSKDFNPARVSPDVDAGSDLAAGAIIDEGPFKLCVLLLRRPRSSAIVVVNSAPFRNEGSLVGALFVQAGVEPRPEQSRGNAPRPSLPVLPVHPELPPLPHPLAPPVTESDKVVLLDHPKTIIHQRRHIALPSVADFDAVPVPHPGAS